MAEYICFFHPRIKSTNASDLCGVCGRPFDFPQHNLPSVIDNFEIEGLAGRGFYSIAVFARDQRTGIASVLKITPAAVYDQPDPDDETVGGYGDRRNFEDECRLHYDVSDLSQIARILLWGRSTADFNGTPVACCWSQMERIDGTSIEDAVDLPAPLAPRAIAQIVSDLLDLEVSLLGRGVFHNDLHGGNAIAMELPAERARPRAIDERIQVKVFDLGSAARGDLSNEARLNDLEQICRITFDLLDAWDGLESAATAPDLRLAAQLRRVAQYYSRSDIPSRQSDVSDMRNAVQSAFEFAVHPEQSRPTVLQSFDDYYNAQMLPPEFARGLIHDPEGEWASRLAGPGPQLVVGMRGCGKTMLLRSLEWRAQAAAGRDEGPADVRARLSEVGYIGLFVSCAYLLRAPRQRVGPAATQRLYLAYAREAIRSATVSQARDLGALSLRALDEFVETVSAAIPSFRQSAVPPTLPSVEHDLSAAIQSDPTDFDVLEFSPLEAFTELTSAITHLVDTWAGRTVLYLLDDVSKRFVSEEDLDDLLTQFCLRHESFGFKISTESQTQILLSPSGQPAIQGRDYQTFDLGEAVLGKLRGRGGDAFLATILSRRQEALNLVNALPPRRLLGSKPTKEIALQLQAEHTRSGGRRAHYSGLRALAAICVGDIGDVIQVYQRMIVKHGYSSPIRPAQQHAVLEGESNSRLLALVPLDVEHSFFYLHAAAFAQASHRELIANRQPHTDGSPREIGDLFVEVASDDPATLQKVMSLVDNGLYAIVGFRQRSKRTEANPKFQFRLRFRKLLGLKFGMPLSNRDRFELAGDAVSEWLDHPDSEHLSPEPSAATDWVREWIQEDEPDDEADGELEDAEPEDLDALFTLPTETVDIESRVAATPLETGMRSSIAPVPLAHDSLDWASATLVVAAGFEDRALGSLVGLTQKIRVPLKNVIVLRYSGSDDDHGVTDLARKHALEVSVVDVDARTDPTPSMTSLIAGLTAPVVIDVSAMTKSLIYATTRMGLAANDEVWVIHTSAARYEPSSEELKPVLNRLSHGEYDTGLRLLDSLTPGEGKAFTPLLIGEQPVEGSSRSLFIAFVTMKHARVDALLNASASDRVVGIRSVHPGGVKSVQSRVIDRIGQYLVESRNGEIRQVKAMDAQGTYDVLMEYYSQYVLANPFQLEIALTGTKMQTVGAAMFGAVAKPSLVYYSVSEGRDTTRYTHGTAASKLFQVRRREDPR